MSFLFEFEDRGRRLMIENDNRTVYAYLLEDSNIVSDVWIYNCHAHKREPAWDDPNNLPFENKTEYMLDRDFEILSPDQITCRWDDLGVDVYVDSVRTARLTRGVAPGESRLAKKDGPLARRLGDSRAK